MQRLADKKCMLIFPRITSSNQKNRDHDLPSPFFLFSTFNMYKSVTQSNNTKGRRK